MDELRIHQLTKEMVAAELRSAADPSQAAAAIVRLTLETALGAPPEGTERERLIEDAVKGAMTALFLADKDLAAAVLPTLEAVLTASAATLDPTQAMSAALQGIADMRRFAAAGVLQKIVMLIDSKYMGAGNVFAEFLRAPIPGDRSPARIG